MADEEKRSSRCARKYAHVSSIIIKQEIRARMKQVNCILKKPVTERTPEELRVLEESPDIATAVQKRFKNRQLAKERTLEVEDPEENLNKKCEILAESIKKAKNVVIYTGAGISTAASIPDYRGPNGVWTLLQKGMPIKAQDLSDAEPTFTHMSITKLQQEGLVRHVVSQNCDGLHLRSGYPREHLSEVHGNMYIELCTQCVPRWECVRLFDVTERTGMRRHRTGRMCHVCGSELQDTIIHFGEKAPFTMPYNWEEAAKAVSDADVVLCLGSSLKVLKKYACLWNLHKPLVKRPKLYIVNLQWTPKDDSATLKLNGRCDDVMKKVMKILGYEVPPYTREEDPIFRLAVPLYPLEMKTTSKKILSKTKCLDSAELHGSVDSKELVNDNKVFHTPLAANSGNQQENSDEVQGGGMEVAVNEADVTEEKVEITEGFVTGAPGEEDCLSKVSYESNIFSSLPFTDVSSTSSMMSLVTNSSSIRALLRSRLQNRMLPERPSDKYKIIKYLLNKPTAPGNSHLEQLTSHLCNTYTLPGASREGSSGGRTAPESTGPIYSCAGSNVDQDCQTFYFPDTDVGSGVASNVRKNYPALVGALRGLTESSPICSVVLGKEQETKCMQNLQSPVEGMLGVGTMTGPRVGSAEPHSPIVTHTADPAAAGGLKVEGLTPTTEDKPLVLVTCTRPSEPTQDDHPYAEHHCQANCRRNSSEDPTADTEPADVEQSENISPAQPDSAPGWFGKGLNIRKRKKKLK